MKTLEATRPKWSRDGPRARAPALDPRAPALVQAPITEWVHHYKDLVELIEKHILFSIFGVQNQEILIKE